MIACTIHTYPESCSIRNASQACCRMFTRMSRIRHRAPLALGIRFSSSKEVFFCKCAVSLND